MAPGSVVTCRWTGAQAWVVKARAGEGRMLHLISPIVNSLGVPVAYTSHTAGIGDVELITPAPTFEPGQSLMHEDVTYEVIADHGDEVEVLVPASSVTLRDSARLRYPEGNTKAIAKCDIALAQLNGETT
jgi:hypothetical protein